MAMRPVYTPTPPSSTGGGIYTGKISDLGREVEDQEHEPLAFLSGKFSGHSERWSMVKKEEFAIVEAFSKLDHFYTARKVHVFTDHSNLVYIFNPFGHNPGISRHVAHKLMRWAIMLSAYRYVIEHVPGERIVWTDILSLWAAAPSTRSGNKKIALL